MVIKMFNGYKKVNDNFIYLYLDNNYEFASDINTKKLKQNEIIKDTKNFLINHNLTCNNRIYYGGMSHGYCQSFRSKCKEIPHTNWPFPGSFCRKVRVAPYLHQCCRMLSQKYFT